MLVNASGTIGRYFNGDPSLCFWVVGNDDSVSSLKDHINNITGTLSGSNGTVSNVFRRDYAPKIAKQFNCFYSSGKYYNFGTASALNFSGVLSHTWIIWFKLDTSGVLLSKYNPSSNPNTQWRFYVDIGNNAITMTKTYTSSYNTTTVSNLNLNPIASDRLLCVVMVADGDAFRVYVNGVFGGSNSFPNPYITSRPDFTVGLGKDPNTDNYGINGYIGEIGIFKRVLSNNEIWNYYQWATKVGEKPFPIVLGLQNTNTLALHSILETKSQKTVALTSTLDIFGETILVSPEHETSGPSPVTFVWKIPTLSTNEPLHAHLQIDKTSNSFEDLEVDLYSYKDSGFEYWDGSQWQPWPAEGVSSAYYGNNARITVDLTSGIKYWRVRHGREIT